VEAGDFPGCRKGFADRFPLRCGAPPWFVLLGSWSVLPARTYETLIHETSIHETSIHETAIHETASSRVGSGGVADDQAA